MQIENYSKLFAHQGLSKFADLILPDYGGVYVWVNAQKYYSQSTEIKNLLEGVIHIILKCSIEAGLTTPQKCLSVHWPHRQLVQGLAQLLISTTKAPKVDEMGDSSHHGSLSVCIWNVCCYGKSLETVSQVNFSFFQYSSGVVLSQGRS